MSAITIKHVSVSELPATWRARLRTPGAVHVTVRIEEEAANVSPEVEAKGNDAAVDILFGMWSDRADMADVDGYLRQLRAPRYNRDGSRNNG